ncbi:ATP-dependent 6-phosphofructokinase [Texas Phoenix palm phytoplasma]|uniref:6-phosphofructokinase n=1 Tax=Texas Phoenix palm phytoplasma TaxID=176709 RepID=A0ABS5BJE4_9MOLU|nr:ATP-dependent 6-phosphofructokinase [Texas Phoenix palm phytoplasma]MBP3059486.1 ATP-dependent 6-phosphofructokinase [Texas Phoenix palm phytoplasma]
MFNKKVAVLTSGGDSPGMNAAIKAIVYNSIYYGYEVYGIQDGFKGIYENKIIPLNKELVFNIGNKGGTILGTSRCMSLMTDPNKVKQSLGNLKKNKIEKLIIIGGNGSYKGAMVFEKSNIKCIALPGTIDNDIPKNDFSIGFSTAINTIMELVLKLKDTAQSHKRCMIIETMGRYEGHLTLYGGIASSCELIITRENLISKNKILEKVKSFFNNGNNIVNLIITEGIMNIYELAQDIEKSSGYECRTQVLGHIQRGGKPTAEDFILATKMGSYSVELLNKNIHNCGICIQNNRIRNFSFEEIFKNKKKIENLYSIFNKFF